MLKWLSNEKNWFALIALAGTVIGATIALLGYLNGYLF